MIWVLRLVSLVRDVRLWSIEEVLGQPEIRSLFFGRSRQTVEKTGWVVAPTLLIGGLPCDRLPRIRIEKVYLVGSDQCG